MVEIMKKAWSPIGIPVANMWWAQTNNEMTAIPAVASAIAV